MSINKGQEFVTSNMASLCINGEISVPQLMEATRVLFVEEENNPNVDFLNRGMLSVSEFVRLVSAPKVDETIPDPEVSLVADFFSRGR